MPLAEDQDAAACSQPRVLAGLVVRSPSGFCKAQAMEMKRQ